MKVWGLWEQGKINNNKMYLGLKQAIIENAVTVNDQTPVASSSIYTETYFSHKPTLKHIKRHKPDTQEALW
jgi:hypothetical protein